MFDRCRALSVVILVCGQMVVPIGVLALAAMQPAVASGSHVQLSARFDRKKMDPKLEHIRKRLIADRSVSTADLRRLADAGDGLAAFAFAKRLAAEGKARLASDAAHYYAAAAAAGRSYAVRPLLEIVEMPEAAIKPAHLKQAERALTLQASRGNDTAIDGLLRLYGSEKPFGAKPEEVARLLNKRILKGDGDAAYRLAIIKLSASKKTLDSSREVIGYLEIAAKTGSLGVRASSASIITLLRADTSTALTEKNQ
jgi:hypothetical protein